ncbi:MAG: hypothetical protein JWQ01_2369 [Massilia sp.]|nr:hypothetical protein [Massilia sp.]
MGARFSIQLYIICNGELTMLEPLEAFLNSPALMVEVAEGAGGKAPGIELIGHQDAYFFIGSDMTDRAYLLRFAGHS